jgi:hypothetical protein
MGKSFSPYPYLCSELVSIAGKGDPHSPAVQGNLEAIGECSVLLYTEVPFRRGAEISIHAGSHVLRGTVEQCRYDEPLGCFMDVRLNPESRWSEQWFEPQHLLAVSTGRRAENEPKVLTLENASVTEDFLRAGWVPRCKTLQRLRLRRAAGSLSGGSLVAVSDSALRQVVG